MTLNGVMAVILRYFTEFVYEVRCRRKQLSLPRFQNVLLIVYDQLFSDYLGKTNSDNWV